MLEGLEVSEIEYSKIDIENRFDSEFYQTIFLENEKTLKLKPFFLVGEKFKVTDGEHGSVIEQESGIKYLTAENVKNGYVDISNVRYVDEEVDRKNARARVAVGDILISIKGTLGAVGIAEEWLLPANMNRDVAILKPQNEATNSAATALFLMSRYGLLQSSRGGSGGVQQMITLERLRKFIHPNFSLKFCDVLEQQIQNIQNLRISSESAYAQAEQALLEAVGLSDFKPSMQNTNIKTFAQSFGSSGRLDAEYYQPKYEDYLKLISDYKNGWAKLAEICTLKDANFNPTNETNYQYIELSDIDKSGGISGCTKDIGENLPSRARRFVNAGDVVVSSIEGSLSSCALVPTEYNNALCSTGFYVIKSAEINSETLLVLMKSELMQSLLKQSCSGTILTAMNKDEFSNLPIPKIDLTTQANVSQLVQQSFSLKAQSEHLLNVAKRAVEMAIEQDEAAAMAFITKSL